MADVVVAVEQVCSRHRLELNAVAVIPRPLDDLEQNHPGQLLNRNSKPLLIPFKIRKREEEAELLPLKIKEKEGKQS